MVEREEEFLPVVSLDDKNNEINTWREAYQEYKNKKVKTSVLKQINFGLASLVSMSDDGG